MVFKESFSRKCSWGTYATFTEGFPVIFHEGPFSSWNPNIFLLILSADFELGAECLPSGGLPLPAGGLKGRLVPLGFDLGL